MKAAVRKQPRDVTAALEASPRPFRNHYVGRISACSTFEGAAIAAFARLIRGESTKAQVVGPNGTDALRLHWTSYGISTTCADRYKPTIAPPRPSSSPKLRRVK
jgi:hypothetical protein